MVLTGKQYGTNSRTGMLEQIDPELVVNFRTSYQMNFYDDLLAEIYVRVNNLFDAPTLSKIGLPGSGRMFYLGLVTNL